MINQINQNENTQNKFIFLPKFNLIFTVVLLFLLDKKQQCIYYCLVTCFQVENNFFGGQKKWDKKVNLQLVF